MGVVERSELLHEVPYVDCVGATQPSDEVFIAVDDEHCFELEVVECKSFLVDIVFGLFALGKLLDDVRHELNFLAATELGVKVESFEGLLEQWETH